MTSELMAVPEQRGGAVVFDGGLLNEEMVVELEKQVQLVRRQRLALVKLTEPDHWRDFGGKPYLEDGGIQVIASTLGIEFGEPKTSFEEQSDEEGKVIVCRCAMTATLRGRTASDIGSATSRDGIYKGISLSILKNEIEKKAITNSQHRALSKLTGLGGVTWSLLDQIGYGRGKGGTVRFKGSEGKMSTGVGEWTPIKEKIWAQLVEIAGGEDAAAIELQKFTANPKTGYAGLKDPAALSAKQADWLAPRVKAEWEKLFDTTAQAQAQPEREPGAEG